MIFSRHELEQLNWAAIAVPEIATEKYLLGTRGNGFIWAVSEKIPRSDLDLSDHEDWIYEYLAVPFGGTYFDVGGFVGTHAVRIAKECAANVVVFEPVPDHLDLIDVNARLNGVKLGVIPKAAGNSVGRVGFWIGGLADSFVAEQDSHEDRPMLQVEMTTIDHESTNLERFDVMKIDVEGYECHVLEGSVKTVARHKPKIIVEVHSHLPRFAGNGNKIVEWCQRNGYNYRRIWDNGGGYFYLELTP
jgi:FkbM family methyltransferase